MTPREYFGLIVRTIGLLLLVFGLYELLTCIYVLVTPSRRHLAPSPAYGTFGLFYVIVSLYLLRGAPALMRFCYPN